ncbi:FtsH protease activity modulator HflK [Trinickia fusca]|uniref:Protein HflK n=1 Tax=Trinickia fusca TaxID=2419777 RepID=A0A494XXI3_9BURK|nr:FtsH protease activity modulator HflK [Trinickia fusca]RKP52829.1 FtsH protease activity modulator HflK [Trinickia fusca]
MNQYNERSFWTRARAVLSISDPRWGRSDGNGSRQRPNEPKRPSGDGEGPPDLDEMWREFNRRLSRLFGGKRSGGGGDRRPDNGHAARVGVGIVIGVLVAIYVGSGVFVVQDGQAGVVLQFGKYRSTVGPGVHLRMPYPFETSEIVNVTQVRSVEVGRSNVVSEADVKDASMLTRDGDIVDVRVAVQYQVKSPTDYLFHDVDPDRSVTQAAQAAVRELVGTRRTGELLDQNHDAMRGQLTQAIQRSLDLYRTGLAVTGVTIQSVAAPQPVQAAFEDVTRAREDRARAKRDAQAYASELLPRAQGDAARTVDDAKVYAERVVGEAQGDAERFKQVYAQYAKAPAVVRERMYLETMREIYSNTTKVFVTSKGGNSVINLSLDKLLEARGHAAGEAAGASASAATAVAAAGASSSAAAQAPARTPALASAPASQAATAASDTMRSRETFRSRSREDELQP